MSEHAERRDDPAAQHLEERLDEALAETFPASDPVQLTDPDSAPAVHTPKRPGGTGDEERAAGSPNTSSPIP